MFEPQHCGLIFTDVQIQHARKNKKRAPLKSAWEDLQMHSHTDPLATIQWQGWQYRFNADMAAGEQAIISLQTEKDTDDQALPYFDALGRAFVLAQCFEMLRDHPAYEMGKQAQYLDSFWDRISRLNERVYEPSLLETLWVMVMNAATAIVLEREPIFTQVTQVYRNIIDTEVHPEGYLADVVDYPEVESLRNQILAALALSLVAEMGANSGVNLWEYENRGVSAITAVTYPLYYYYYPEKWQWNGEPYKPSDGVELEVGQQLFKAHPGFMEIADRRYDKPLKAIEMILGELRPVYDFYGGGPLTLAYAKPKRRGLFG